MSARSIRRAAQRIARKVGRQATTPESPVSAAQVAANRENAQLSTGPRSETGKAASSLNALKTALTGRTVILPSEDVAEYQRNILAYQEDFQPIGYLECDLVQSIADTAWRLRRIASLEQALFSKGRLEFAELFAEIDPAQRAALIDLHTYQTYEKTFRNLQLQEARLARRREKEIAELRRLQQERKANEAEALERATSAHLLAIHRNQPADPPEIGFEFSKQTFDAHLAGLTSQKKAEILQKALATVAEPLETMLAKPASTGRPETMQATA